jgi:hypothetical protein
MKRFFEEAHMVRITRPMIVAGLLTFMAMGEVVQAQESGIIQATATVLSALTVRGEHNLEFGTVTPGVLKSVNATDVGFAGEWSITGPAAAEVTLEWDLPDSLILQDSTVGLPISFSNTDASYDDGTGGGQTAPAGILNPNGVETEDIGIGGTMSIWIGGTVLPRLSQTGGNYSANVVLTVTLTGS